MSDIEKDRRGSRGAIRICVWVAIAGLSTAAHTAQAQTTYRMTSISYDYDNNGLADATTTISYDAAGEPTDIAYDYIDDGTPDLFVTEDDDAAFEDGTFVFDGSGFVTATTLDRTNASATTESFELDQIFTAGRLTRSESENDIEGALTSTFATFSYVGGNLDQVVERRTADDALQFTQTYAYGGDALPDLVTLSAPGFGPIPGLDIISTFNWRADGQVDDVETVWMQGATVIGGGSGDYVYDAQNRRVAEVFEVDVSQGSFYAEFFGRNYRKTLHYDALGLLSHEEVDLEDDGSIEATRTATWQAGDCTPVFIWAANGRPEFAAAPGSPYVPGTGWQSLRNCPEPAQGLSLLMGTGALSGFARRRRPRA